MRCRYTFAVVSDARLPVSLRFSRGVTEFTLKADKQRFVALIVEQPNVRMANMGTITAPPPGGIGNVTVPTDALLPFVQMEIRSIRGALALWSVYDIEVDRPQVEWLPESEAEAKALQISAFKYSHVPLGAREPHPVPLDQLVRPFLSWQGFRPMEIPLEFYRRGGEDLARGHFVEAIYDFYFVLEFLFADGKFKTNDVRDAFLKSDEAKRVITESQRHPMPDIRDNSTEMAKFNARYRNRTVEEVIATITDLRGLLHHQSMTRKKNWNPASPEEFKVDAFFLCAVAHSAVLNLSTSLLFTPDEEAKFNATSLFTPDGKRVTLQPMPEPPGAAQFSVPPPRPFPEQDRTSGSKESP